MEMIAAIRALEIMDRPCEVIIITDSQYLRNGITDWIRNWKRNGWKSSSGKPVKNADLWRRLDELVLKHEVTWEWVPAHAGYRENEIVDALAKEAMGKSNN
jgi:ribonuclease HI